MLSFAQLPPELLALMGGQTPFSMAGHLPPKDPSRVTGKGQNFGDFGLMDDLIAGGPGQQAVTFPQQAPQQAMLPQGAMPTQGQIPPGAPMPQPRGPMGMPQMGAPPPSMPEAPQGGPQGPMGMPQMPQQQGGGFMEYLKGLSENPAFLAGITTLGGQGAGAGASIANASRLQRTGNMSSDIQEYEYAKRQGYAGTFQEWSQLKRGGAGETGLNPVWGEKDGEPVLGQLNKKGEFIATKLPEGVSPSKGVDKVDLGTHWGVISKVTGQLISSYPKDLKGAAAATKAGGELGGDIATLESMNSKMPGLETVVKELDDLAGKATYTMAGQGVDAARRQAGMEPRESSVARARYISMVDNQILPLLRDTFGSQFTQKEGESLRTTLGDANKSPKEKQAVLRAFIEQKRRDVEALAKRTGQVAPGGVRKYNPATGKIE